MADAKEILLTFIADEDAAMKEIRQGEYYIYHHYEIVRLIPRAGRLLDDDDLVSFYFHLLRQGIVPAIRREEDYELLREAYEALAPLLGTDSTLCGLERAAGLLLFGHDGEWALAAQPRHSLDFYMYYRKVWAHVNAYVSVPTMLDKKARFLAYTEDPQLCLRIIHTLRALRYCAEEPEPFLALWFWGLVYIVVLERQVAEAVLADMTGLFAGTPQGRQRLEILRRYLEAAGSGDLAGKVDALVAAARAA